MIDALIATANMTRGQTLKLVADLTDDQLVEQPAPGTNHPAWVLGHLLQVEHNFLNLIKPQPQPLAFNDDAWKSTYAGKSIPQLNKSLYKPKQFYIDELAKAREQIIARLKTITPQEFSAPHPDPVRRERFPTVGHMVMMYSTFHEAYHAGQLSAWRRVQGLPAV